MKSSWICLLLAGCLTGSAIGGSDALAKKPVAKAKPTTSRPATKPLVDPGGCYLVDASGRTVSLGTLCGSGSGSVSSSGSGSGGVSNSGPKANPRVISIPIKYRVGRNPVIEVTFNGNRRFDMIVNNALGMTLVAKAMANALKLNATGSASSTIGPIGNTRKVTFPTSKITSITVGELSTSNAEAGIVGKELGEELKLGLLGFDFFKDYTLQIKEKTIGLSRR
jgi:gag-polyprotein putative aspartyl protease